MNKALIAGLFLLSSNVFVVNDINAQEVEHVKGFECANELLPSIELLGRGSDFPSFVVEDVATELKRQHSQSNLVAIECIGEPRVEVASKPVEGNATQSVLKELSVTFPLKVDVQANNEEISLFVDHKYHVENMDTPTEKKVTQNFIVLNQIKTK